MESTGTPKRRLAAIMFSDICGFSALMGDDEDRGLEIMNLHTRLAEKAVLECDGHIIKKMADGLLFEFSSAVCAVECALLMQTSLRDFNEENPDDTFQVRIGVHLGDVVVSGDDIHGDGINVASRIEPLAPPGGICISQDVYNLVHNKVEIQTVSLGPQQLKNIKRQMEIFRVLVAASDAQDGYTVKTIPREEPDATKKAPRQRRWWPLVLVAAVAALIALGVLSKRSDRKQDLQSVKDSLHQVAALMNQGKIEEASEILEDITRRGPEDAPHMEDVRKALAAIARIDDAAQALQKAEAMLHEGNRLDAVRLLQQAKEALPKDMPGTENLTRKLASLRHEAMKQHARDRFVEWLYALRDKDWDTAAEFADPKSKMKHGLPAIARRVSLLGSVAGILKLSPDHVRVHDITIDKNGKQAHLTPEFLTKDGWQPQKASRWILHEDQWYLRLEDKTQRDSRDPRSDPSQRFPRRPGRFRSR